ncbi:drebrin-like protein isoform X3 [Eucyclogobius newberryi]|uniref:drebrin-like protein isoform X3 n=1 Tax=Eucyclogobius newberryi TaxID=166745 RepID=UPI003B5A06CC
MSTRTINLDTYSLSLLTAKEDIINPRSSINWALFVYDGISNKLRLADSGVGGVAELASKLHTSQAQYGLCRMVNADSGSSRTAMIIWMGQDVDDFRRTECASHIPAIKNFFKEVNVFLNAEKSEEVTEERIKAELSKAHTNASTQWLRRSSQSSMDRKDIVGTNYRKTNAAMEMRLANRDSFWARAEREEEERKEEERKRAAEERRRLERERTLKERQDAEERDRKMNEKLKMIEEQRQIAAEQEEEGQRKEKFKWELQQREHEEEMRARLKRSESIEKAAEAAALVSQRTMNPREFFRQLSSSSSLSPTSPSRSGKPFRRYQRSLTDTAFIFSKAEESSASSPRSSPVVSPFSRASPSPFNRATSPPTSPLFLPSTSPQRTRASPPLSPPPSSALPSVPLANIQMRGRARSPSEPSAPPASPTLVASVGLSSAGDAPGSPPNVTEHNAFNFELNASPPAPRASLPEHPISDPISEESLGFKCLTPDSAVNVIPNGNSREHNGTDHSLSPSDPELDSPELAVYCNVRDDEEDDICIQKYITISENGEEVSAEPHLCVRALYDYQAEDESELSFELGDIIRDVEAVDKGWWRGWSQDGRQGLFPANYVETISPQ